MKQLFLFIFILLTSCSIQKQQTWPPQNFDEVEKWFDLKADESKNLTITK